MPLYETKIDDLEFTTVILDGGKFAMNTFPEELKTDPLKRKNCSEILVNAMFKHHPFDYNKIHWIESFEGEGRMELLYLTKYGQTIRITDRIVVEREKVFIPE